MNKTILAAGLAVAAAAVAIAVHYEARAGGSPAPDAIHSSLPTLASARHLVNSTTQHREWVNLPLAPAGMRVFVAYPQRSDRAPAVIVTGKGQSASVWLRGVALELASEGYIAVVPDLLSGMATNGGDADSFAGPEAIAAALGEMDRGEMARRINLAREYATSLPAANGSSASLELDRAKSRIQTVAGIRGSEFNLTPEGWSNAVRFLAVETNNHPLAGANPNLPEDHSAHMFMAAAQTPPQPGAGRPLGYPMGKTAELPAGIFTARSTLLKSSLKRGFVDIAMETVKLHTWVEYPAGDGKAAIAIVMQHGPGMDEWQRALADQLAQEGFIAIAADLHSGLGPNGGNYDSFQGTDDVLRATARLTGDEMMRRYKAAREWGLKLSRANGKVATIGFCMGGGNSFRFVAEVPETEAAVVYYGNTPDEATLSKIKAPVIAFYGEDDARVTAQAEPTAATMKRLGKSFEYHVYPHATHGFLEFQDLAGNPAATSDSWSRTIMFLKEHTK
jgi:carboxymethylenebutenolidase